MLHQHKAKRKDGKGWVWGYPAYCPYKTDFYIKVVTDIPPTWSEPGGGVSVNEHDIDCSTLCRPTGIKVNHQMIYEHDYIKVHQFLFDGNEIEKEWEGYVVWMDQDKTSGAGGAIAGFGIDIVKGDFYFEHSGFQPEDENKALPLSFLYGLHEESFQIINNKFDNY